MREFSVPAESAGQRLEKYLKRLLPNAQSSFLFKMLRKKNITLNGKRADGSEHVEAGDVVRLFFSDETYEKFAGHSEEDRSVQGERAREYRRAYETLQGIRIVFETGDAAVLCKRAGLLSQKAREGDLTANEWFVGYLLARGEISEDALTSFTPSVANRLDRNTEGLVLAGKTLRGSRMLSQCLRERTIGKYYEMIVQGTLEREGLVTAYLQKDEKTNTVKISRTRSEGASLIKTRLTTERVSKDGKRSLVGAELITGKTHQLRAQLSFLGHPILGDPKYGDPEENRKFHLTRQLLVCSRVVFPELPDFPELSGRTVQIPLPERYERVLF